MFSQSCTQFQKIHFEKIKSFICNPFFYHLMHFRMSVYVCYAEMFGDRNEIYSYSGRQLVVNVARVEYHTHTHTLKLVEK
jgi:hypothetical protein